MWIQQGMAHQPGSHRVGDDVADREGQFHVIANDPVETIPLPQRNLEFVFEMEPGVLLRARGGPLYVGLIVQTRGDQVDVIWHEAVHSQRELTVARSAQELRSHQLDFRMLLKEWS